MRAMDRLEDQDEDNLTIRCGIFRLLHCLPPFICAVDRCGSFLSAALYPNTMQIQGVQGEARAGLRDLQISRRMPQGLGK